MAKNLKNIILLGAAWGIFEASVGYLLHISGMRIGSYIWFPVAYFFVHRAYRLTGSFPAAMLTAFIASALKLVNLFFPGRIDMVINPAVSIILEAFAIVLVYKYVLDRQMDKVNPLTVALVGFIWRGLYIFYIFSMPTAYFSLSSFTAVESFLSFMFVKNIATIAVISAGFAATKVLSAHIRRASAALSRLPGRKLTHSPAFAPAMLALAVAVQALIG